VQNQLAGGWQELGVLAKSAVFILLLSAVPTGIALWRLAGQIMVARSARLGVTPRSPRRLLQQSTAVALRWAIVEALTLVVALGLFWVSWAAETRSLDCAGAGCAQGLSKLRAVHLAFMTLCGIPMLGAGGWVLIRRMSGAPWQI